VIPRSVLLAVFEEIPYLLCALGDGQLFNWQLDSKTGELQDKKKICLGTKPIMLRSFRCLVLHRQNGPTSYYLTQTQNCLHGP